jgi:hypothetical protein
MNQDFGLSNFRSVAETSLLGRASTQPTDATSHKLTEDVFAVLIGLDHSNALQDLKRQIEGGEYPAPPGP